MPSQDAAQLQHLLQVAEEQEAVIKRRTPMDKGDLHVSRRSKHSDFNLTKSDVKVRTNNRNESPFKSMRDSHSVWSFTPDIGSSSVATRRGIAYASLKVILCSDSW